VLYSLNHELQGFLILSDVNKWAVTKAGSHFHRLSTVLHRCGLGGSLLNRRVHLVRLRPSV